MQALPTQVYLLSSQGKPFAGITSSPIAGAVGFLLSLAVTSSKSSVIPHKAAISLFLTPSSFYVHLFPKWNLCFQLPLASVSGVSGLRFFYQRLLTAIKLKTTV